MKMDELRSSLLNIGFIGQDPIEKFEREANKMFISMDEFVQNEIIAYVTKPNMAFGTYEVEEERHEIHY